MKEERKAYRKVYYEAHKEERKAASKAWHAAHREEHNAYMKAYNKAHKEQRKASRKAWHEANKEQYKAYMKAYIKSDVNSKGQTKNSIRKKSLRILKQMNLHIHGYEIHHCFGYEEPSKFIYISKALHLKIHQYLRDNNIDASTDHWMAIRDLVNDTDEFTYVKC